MRRPISRFYEEGPQGGVYYVASSGARVYVDRSAPLGYRSSGSRLLSINPGDKDYGQRPSQTVASEASDFGGTVFCFCFFSVLFGLLFGHPFWLLKLPFQILNYLLWAGIHS